MHGKVNKATADRIRS